MSCIALCQRLPAVKAELTYLGLEYNELTDISGAALAVVLPQLTKLQKLRLGNNPGLSAAVRHEIEFAAAGSRCRVSF